MVYTDTQDYYSFKKWNFAIYSNMDGLGRHYAKWDKSDGKTNTVLYHLMFVWYIKNTTSECNKNEIRLTDIENKLLVGRGKREKVRSMGD